MLQVIKNPVSDYLPVGARKYATSFSANEIVRPSKFIPLNEPVVIVVGAMAHGSVSRN